MIKQEIEILSGRKFDFMTRREKGFRFVYRRGTYMWVHPTMVQYRDTDCTDMDDEAFQAFVRTKEGTKAKLERYEVALRKIAGRDFSQQDSDEIASQALSNTQRAVV